MTKFNSFDEAAKSLEKNGFMSAKDDLFEDVAAVAAFLCNEGQFETALAQVSSSIWYAYMGLPAQTKNKFSRALGMAAQHKGFSISTADGPDTGNSGKLTKAPLDIKLIGSDKVFVDMLEGGQFWKDSMNLRHGEYSHALQWLAVAEEFGRRALQVYKATPKHKSTNGILLWSWLADCFPNNAAGGDERVSPATQETLKSNTYRSPQVITDHLIGRPDPIPGHFVSYYLHTTYSRRGLLSFKQPKHDPNAAKVADYGSLSGAVDKAKHDANWKPAKDNENRLLRQSANTDTATKTNAIPMTFHGQTGNFYV